jgi:hypothetical protein
MTWKCDKCGTENNNDAEECASCKQNQVPYYRKNLEPSKVMRDQFTVELNSEERKQLEELKNRWDFKSDSKVLKLCLENAINSQEVAWCDKTWRYVLSTNRQRLSNFQKLLEPSLNENAMQK